MHKLVRDFIPDLMREEGKTPNVQIMYGDADYLDALHKKLFEELGEYVVSLDTQGRLEELADFIEVVRALEKHVETTTSGELTRVRERKLLEKGGFEKRQYLVSVG